MTSQSASTATALIWLPSYPRSGNTWLRFLLTNLFYTENASQEDADIFINDQVDRMINPKDGSPRQDFSAVNPENFFRLHNDDVIWTDKMMRTHHSLDKLIGLMPQSIGFIYVIRHPLDVALSCLNYDLLHHPTIDPEDYRASYITTFIETYGANTLAAQGYGINWINHVESWIDNQEDLPGIVIRYEDMLADTPSEMRRICQFLDVDLEDEAIARAVEYSDFTHLRKIEEQAIQSGAKGSLNNPDQFKERHQQGFRFVNQGKAGLWRSKLTEEEIALAEKAFAPTAQRFGYSFH